MCLCGCESNAGKPFVVSPTVRNIFCDECTHYRDTMIQDGDVIKNRCNHPDVCNRSCYCSGTPITKGFTRKWVYPGDCISLNKDNNCRLFEQIEWPDRSEG